MTHINILYSYVSFDQVCTIIPQEIWSNHQKGKMVKIRVFDWERAISDFWPSKWPIGLKHYFKGSIASSWPNDMVQNIAISLDWQKKFAVNWSKVNCILKSQTLTFWSKSSSKDQNSSKHVKMWNLFVKESNIEDLVLKFEFS